MLKFTSGLLLSLLITTSAVADERFLPYIEWITENSSYTYNGEPLPTVEQVDPRLLEILMFGEEQVATAELEGYSLPEVHAVYDHEKSVIVTPDDEDPFSYDNQYMLVHELVHYLQFSNNKADLECLMGNEREAYELYWQWVEETGHTAEEPNWLFVYMLEMSCRPDY